MDGNGRWAQHRGLSRSAGHRAGVNAARDIVTECRRLGIPYLSLYTFSRENWNRPREEISAIFSLLVEFLTKELPSLLRQSIRLNVLGELEDLSAAARTTVRRTMDATASCSAMTLNLALNYGGRDEIVRAARRLVEDGLAPDAVTEETFRERLYTAGQPDPDFIIRTSGELRISNYLLFQSAYSEFYFTDTLWPDFTPALLQQALDDYAGRRRRFGKTQEQIL